MERNVKYFSIGFAFVVIAIGLVMFIMWIGRFDIVNNKYKPYYIYTQDTLSQIGVNTPVKFKGLSIGRVSAIGFEDYEKGLVKISLLLDKQVVIRDDSYVSIDSEGLMGSNIVEFFQGEGAISDSNILAVRPKNLNALIAKVGDISSQTEKFLHNANDLLAPKNLKSIENTLISLEKTTKSLSLAMDSEKLSKILDNIESLTNMLNENMKNGQYDVANIVNPTLIQVQDLLAEANSFFVKATDFMEKFDESPYNALFGSKKGGKK